MNLLRARSALSRSKGAASTFACMSRSSIMRSRAFFSVSSRSLILVSFNGRGSAPRCRRESHAYTDPAAGAIDQWRVGINRSHEKARIAAGFLFHQPDLPAAISAAAEAERYAGAAAVVAGTVVAVRARVAVRTRGIV